MAKAGQMLFSVKVNGGKVLGEYATARVSTPTEAAAVAVIYPDSSVWLGRRLLVRVPASVHDVKMVRQMILDAAPDWFLNVRA